MSISRYRIRPRLESAICLDLKALRAKGAIEPGQQWQGTLSSGDSHGSALLLSMSVDADAGVLVVVGQTDQHPSIACTIAVATSRPPFGGLRWWLRCPVSGRLAAKLYLFPDQQFFCHRTAIKPFPSYPTQRMTEL